MQWEDEKLTLLSPNPKRDGNEVNGCGTRDGNAAQCLWGAQTPEERRVERRDRCLRKWENHAHREWGYGFTRAPKYAVLKCGRGSHHLSGQESARPR
jgi:hypothetical protein